LPLSFSLLACGIDFELAGEEPVVLQYQLREEPSGDAERGSDNMVLQYFAA
jgi:hypothetical protein